MKTSFSLMLMTYPPAPWNLYGNALQSLHLVDLERAKALVPADLETISVLPGKTLGGLYLSIYDASSTLSYHELIVVAALVRHKRTIGFWISHIYVDHPDSMEGGRNIWGLPKEIADFVWRDREVQVSQGNRPLCRIQYSQVGLPLPLLGKSKISSNVFGGLAQDILLFQGDIKGELKWIQYRLTVPPESPFAKVSLGHPWFAVQLRNLHLTANLPSIAGQWTPKSSCSSNVH
jgi:acetoacetate decarboxylase